MNPQVADFVAETFEQWKSSPTKPTFANLQMIDLEAWNLPMYDEPAIPSQIHHHSEYQHEHTQKWSQEIQKHSAIIFVTPQYNWGYPAVLKNAIDYLFFEWNNKPAAIVTYGGHGGIKCAAQLRQVLEGTRMKIAETMPALSFGSRETLVHAAKGEDIHALGEDSIWKSERGNIRKALDELMVLLGQA